MAAVFWLSLRRRAMVCLSLVILTRSSRAASSAGLGGGGGGGLRGGGGGLGHVFLHHATIAARALHLIAVDALFGHRLFRRGGIFDILAGGGGFVTAGLIRRLGAGLRLDRAIGGTGEDGELATGLHGVALLREDFAERACGGGGHLDRDLVGFQLAQHLVLRDAVADLLEPSRDGGLGDGFAKRGDHHVGVALVAIAARGGLRGLGFVVLGLLGRGGFGLAAFALGDGGQDRKSTRLN